jgi:hypothetical protein
VERLEDRRLLDSTLFNQARHLVELKSDAVATAVAVNVLVNGVFAGTGDQIVISYDVDAGAGFDFRQRTVIDTNGLLRVKHTDSDVAAGTEDKFGTSIKLPPGIVVDGPQFFLTSRVEQINLLTDQADAGILKLRMFGRPANGPGTSNPTTLPVSVDWTLTIQAPTANTFLAELQTSAFFEQTVNLSFNHLLSAEAFRVAEFSSSNVPASNTTLGVRTHDADQLRLCSNTGTTLATVDLNAAPTNSLLTRSSSTTARCLELNQVSPAPLNADPPNASLEVLADNATYRGQGFITVNETIDENSDNVGAWLAREFVSTSIQAGSRIDFTIRVGAADPVVDPTKFTARVYRAYNPTIDAHFFTTAASEFTNAVNNGYRDESTGRSTFAISPTAIDGARALHRLYNRVNGAHYYTMNDQERDVLVSVGWTFEKDEGYLFADATLCAREVFRLYNNNSGRHLFTDDPSIKNAILARYPGVWVQHASLGWTLPFVEVQTASATRVARSTRVELVSINDPLHWVGDPETQIKVASNHPDAGGGGLVAGRISMFQSQGRMPDSRIERSVVEAVETTLDRPRDGIRTRDPESPLIDALWSEWGRIGAALDQ